MESFLFHLSFLHSCVNRDPICQEHSSMNNEVSQIMREKYILKPSKVL